VATDSAGRTTTAEKTFTVEGTGNSPVVAFSSPPTGAVEGSTVHIVATASDVDGDLQSLTLLQDGVQIASSASGTARADAPVRLRSAQLGTTFRAVGQDAQGHQTAANTTVSILPNTAPTVTLTSDQPSYATGQVAHLCAKAEDDVGVASLASVVNSATVATTPTSCGPRCLQQCVDFPVNGGTSL